MKLSLCITTYNRYEMTVESFAQVIDDPRIDDIVILDDASTDGSGMLLAKKFGKHEKVRIILQHTNKGMSQNKHDAIAFSRNEWCIIFDSDNIIDARYLDSFFKYTSWGDKQLTSEYNNYIFCPDFAQPNFDYRRWSRGGRLYDAKDCARIVAEDNFNMLLNTCNYIVNRDFYLQTYKHNQSHVASDTIWHNYNHLKAGGIFAVVPGMQYYHRVHDGSGFMKDAHGNMSRAEEVRKLIQQL